MTPLARRAATAAGRLSASMSPVTALPPARPLYANTAIPVLPLRQRDSEDLLDRRGPLDHLHQSGLPKGLHAVPLGLFTDLGRRRILQNHVTKWLGDGHHFIDGDATLHSREVARRAALPAVERHVRQSLGGVPIGNQILFAARHRLPAVFADPAAQSLGEDEQERGRQQEWLDAHVEQPRDRRRTVVRVQRREDQMARQGGADRDLRRFEVTRLAYENDVRVLSQERAEDGGE